MNNSRYCPEAASRQEVRLGAYFHGTNGTLYSDDLGNFNLESTRGKDGDPKAKA